MTPVAARRSREQDLVAATRRLFDERGMQDAPIEEIARAVGIARGLIYRHFSSKEELFVLTVTDYLDELDKILADAVLPDREPVQQLEAWARAYGEFCLRYPAFLDCALSLMRGSARELHERVSESVWLRLGQRMARCVSHVTRVLGEIGVEEPDYTATVLWTQTLGIMHLARTRVGVREAAPNIPELFVIERDRVLETVVRQAVAAATV
jgi:AcrR family transcriptional regulator